jgi:rare lipoprotein A
MRKLAVRVVAVAVVAAGCSSAAPAAPVPGRPQLGVASWYGPGFHGRATTSGEIYDQDELTAAHPTLPLGTRVRVTNLETQRSVIVRVNDRGPFVKERAIDLSHAAAREVAMLGPGTAPVRIDVVERPPGGYSYVLYAVQVGAFRERDRASALRAALVDDFSDVYISPVRSDAELLYRVRVGPYEARHEAERSAGALASAGLRAVVTEEPRP